jgi:hypothetical protein
LNPDERLAELFELITWAGIPALVLGGHAVRFYGVERNTILSAGAEEEKRAPGSMIEEILSGPLRKVAPGSARHLALVESVRRLYRRSAMDADRKDKLRQAETPPA